ncbi:hypothetical protein QFW96_03095 [Saccharopolyspora sp. TS4A08]|uniref:Uncharacterized protein n=1 Tax=Saccharopolyspora ipomoeae TaxID=3042027 RepID=A0ABT6PIV2_9PSEU|nr:hypothetical protein [Saccharopolyspora sp. TS4A08]MDI2027578.1 hypothetical protein [Saccharopolyspora sp. TS4A08]
MTVSESLGAALVARQWCTPEVPILWACWQEGTGYRVPGYDSFGHELPKKKRGSIAGAVGGFLADAALTAVFGDGDDHSGTGGGTGFKADLRVVGPSMDCTSVRLYHQDFPHTHNPVKQLWVLTPGRLTVLIPLSEDSDPKPKPESSGGWRDLLHKQEEYGLNQPGEPVPAWRITPWFELPLNEITHCQVVGPKRKPHHHCGLEFSDRSGFVLDARTPRSAEIMATTINQQRGIRG